MLWGSMLKFVMHDQFLVFTQKDIIHLFSFTFSFNVTYTVFCFVLFLFCFFAGEQAYILSINFKKMKSTKQLSFSQDSLFFFDKKCTYYANNMHTCTGSSMRGLFLVKQKADYPQIALHDGSKMVLFQIILFNVVLSHYRVHNPKQNGCQESICIP